MLHLKVFTDRLTRQQKDTMVLNTSCPELARLIFGEHITIETLADQNQLQAEYDAKGGGYAASSQARSELRLAVQHPRARLRRGWNPHGSQRGNQKCPVGTLRQPERQTLPLSVASFVLRIASR